MNERGGKDFCLGETLSTKPPCPNYFQFWQPRGWLFRVRPPGREIKWGKISDWGAFLFSYDLPLPRRMWLCLAFSFFLKNSTWKGLRNQLFDFDLSCPCCHREAFTFSLQIPTSHPCVFPAWAQHPCLWNGFAGRLLQARLQALQVSSSHTVSKLTWEAKRLALRVGQVAPFSLY